MNLVEVVASFLVVAFLFACVATFFAVVFWFLICAPIISLTAFILRKTTWRKPVVRR